MMRRRAGLAVVAVALLWSGPALAIVVGDYDAEPSDKWKVYGKVVQLGASLLKSTLTAPLINSNLLASSSDTADSFPDDAALVKAYLYWGGREASPGNHDTNVTFQLPDGFSAPGGVNADNCRKVTDPTTNPNDGLPVGTHFFCRADVTALLTQHKNPANKTHNGNYVVGGLSVKVSQPQGTQSCVGDPVCQANHASWSLIAVYDSQSDPVQRDVFLYDGFVLLDEKTTSAGQLTVKIKDFLVPDPPSATLMYHAMEGDKHLGVPPQDQPPILCPTCFDYVEFQPKNGPPKKLTQGAENQDANNIFNSSSGDGVDLDVFDISQLLQPNDTEATFVVSSGDGDITNNTGNNGSGYGELIFYGYTVLQIDRKAPNFKNFVTQYTVNEAEAFPGKELTYTIDLQNNGPLDAENAVVRLDVFPPPGTQYVAGTTTLDGKVVADAGGQSALFAGLNVGTVTKLAGPGSTRKVSFKVKLLQDPGVSNVVSFAKTDYGYLGKYKDSYKTNTTTVKVVAPVLATPLLSVTPGKVAPDGQVTWSLKLQNVSDGALSVASVVVDLPPEVVFGSATGPGTNKSVATGGQFGSGFARFDDIAMAQGQSVSFEIKATVKSVQALEAMGISPIAGHVVSTQGKVTIAGKTLLTDDPVPSGTSDPTTFTLQVLSDFTTSQKKAQDLTPQTPLLPGDTIQFTFVLTNIGPADGTATLTDPLPSQLDGFTTQSPQLTFANGTVSATVTVKKGETLELKFTAKVKQDATPGQTFANVATVSPQDGNPPTVIQTPQLKVEGGPDLATSTKTATDLNGGDVEPGDTLQYTLTFTNSGKLATGQVQITDPVDKSLEAVGDVSNGGAFDAGANAVQWSLPPIQPGQSVVVQFTAKVKLGLANGTAISNVATATTSTSGQTVTKQVTATVKVAASPKMSLFSNVVASSSGKFQPGDTITYTLTLQNTGKGPLVNGQVTSSYDPVLSLVSASAGGTVTGQTVTWAIGTLQPNQTPLVLTVQAKLAPVVAQNLAVSNQASVNGEGLGAPVPSDDPAKPGSADPTVFTVDSAPVLQLVKSLEDGNGGNVQGGDTVTIRISVTNTGNAPATGVVISDKLHAALQQVAVKAGTFDATSRIASWTLPSVAPGAPAQMVELTAVVDKATATGTQVDNTATAAFPETPKSVTSNTISFTVTNLPDFADSRKQAGSTVAKPGEPLTWTLTIANSGNAPATGVVVTDVVPKELLSVQVQGGTFNAGTSTATWNLGALAAGEKKTVTLQGTVQKPLDPGTQICNQATIQSNEAPLAKTSPPNPPDNPNGPPTGQPTCVSVESSVQLDLRKDVFHATSGAQVNQQAVKPKTPLRWQIRVRNTGTAVAKNVTVSDAVPAGLQNVVALDGGVLASGVITWPALASLGVQPQDEVTLRFEATVPVDLDPGTAIANQAEASATGVPKVVSDDPTTAAAGDKTVVTVASAVDLGKSTLTVKDDDGGEAKPGDAVTYTLIVRNDGEGTAKEVAVTVPLDAKLEAVAPGAGASVQGGKLVWAPQNLDPGQQATLTWTAKIKKPLENGAVVTAQAAISAKGLGAPTLSDADPTTPIKEPAALTVVAKADLSTSLLQVVDPNGGAVEPGDTLIYALTVRNTGDAVALQVPVALVLPTAGLEAVQPASGGVVQQGKIVWTIPALQLSPSGDVVLQFTAQVGGAVANGTVLTVGSELPGVVSPPSASVTVVAAPRLETSTVAADDESGWVGQVGNVAPGHVVRIEATLVNTGKAAATGLVVAVPLPAGFLPPVIVTPGGTLAGATASWPVASLAPGQSLTFVLKAGVAPGGKDGDKLALLANVTAKELPQPFVIPGPTLTVTVKPLLKVVKAWQDLSGGHLFPGDALRFTLAVSNAGNAAATGVTVTDALPGGLTGVAVSQNGTVATGVVTWALGDLQPGNQQTVTVDAKLAPAIVSGAALFNQGKATAGNAGEVLSNLVQVPVNYPTLQVKAALEPVAPAASPVHPGDTVRLTVEVSAPGEAAESVTVAVSVPTGVVEPADLGSASFDPVAGTVTWKPTTSAALQQIATGKPAKLEATLKVKANAKNGVPVTALAVARDQETQLPWTSELAQLPVESAPKLKVTKIVSDLDGGAVEPLDLLRYTIAVAVEGGAVAEHVAIADAVPAELEIVSVSDGGKATGQDVLFGEIGVPALAALQPGAVVEVRIDARVKAETAHGTTVVNQAKVSATGLLQPVPSDDPTTAELADATAVKVVVGSALQASTKSAKDDNGAPLLPGDIVTWRILVVATGGAAVQNAKLFDGVPAGTDYLAGSTTLNGAAVPDGDKATSPLPKGLAVNSPGAAAGVVEPGLDKAAVVTFQTKVRADVAKGALVSNTATGLADGQPPVAIGPAELVAGDGPSLRQTTKTAEVQDSNGNGLCDVGERIVYTVTIHNGGASMATGIELRDPIPEHALYVPGSLTVDGKVASDAHDLDAGWFDADKKLLHASVASLAPGGDVVVRFEVMVDGGQIVANQATVTAKGLPPEASDADGNDSNGNQPTLTPIGGQALVAIAAKEVADENGGAVEVGDFLRYTITVRNPGNVDLVGLSVADELPAGVTLPKLVGPGTDPDLLLPPGAVPSLAERALKVKLPDLVGGGVAVVSVRVQVEAKAQAAGAVCNVATVEGIPPPDGAPPTHSSEPACVAVGAPAGSGVVAGVLFEDVGPDDGVYQAGKDLVFPGFTVAIAPPDGVDVPTQTGSADSKGVFRVAGVIPGEHELTVRSATGATFLRRKLTTSQSGAAVDLALKPMGRVYDPRTGEPVAGVGLVLRYDAVDPVAAGAILEDGDLLPGQQGQRTDASGAYAFDAKPGRAYTIEASGVGAGWLFPSAQRAPEPGVAVLDGAGFVVPDALPKPRTVPKYVVRFSRLGGAKPPPPPPPPPGSKVPPPPPPNDGPPAPRHNLLPVDPLSSAIRVTVRLSKQEAQVGEVVHATVEAVNTTKVALVADPLTGKGGVELRVTLPPELALIDGSAQLSARGSGDGAPVNLPVAPLGSGLLVWKRISPTTRQPVGLDLLPGGRLVARFQTVLRPLSRPGQDLRAAGQVFDTGGGALSQKVDAALRVLADPIFDRSLVYGTVWCDDDGDGQRDDGESGLQGATVVADTGYAAVSDRHGRLHFVDVPPGNHLFKLDADTVPPGSTFTTESAQVAYATPGTPLALHFGVACALEKLGPTRIERAASPGAPPPPDLGPGVLRLQADTASLSLAIDGRELPPRFVRARIATQPERPASLAHEPTTTVLPRDANLSLWVEATKGFARHALEVREVGPAGRPGAVVVDQRSEGELPAKLTLRAFAVGLPLHALLPNRLYLARVRGETAYGARAWSAPLAFEVKAADESGGPRLPMPEVFRRARVLVNGHTLPLVAGKTDVALARPDDGRLLVSVRAANGSGRDEYMTVPAAAPKDALAPPQPTPQEPAAEPAPSPPAPTPTPAPLPVKPVQSLKNPPPPAPLAPAPTATAAPEPTVAAAPPVAPVPAVVPIAPKPAPVFPNPVPSAIAVPRLPAAVGPRVAVPLAGPLDQLQIAGATADSVAGKVAFAVPTVLIPLANGRIVGRVVVTAAGVPQDAASASLVLIDSKGKVLLRAALPVPLPRTFLWEPTATDLVPGTYGLALEWLVPGKVAGDRVGRRTVPLQVELASGGMGLVPAGDPDKSVRAELWDAQGELTESAREWVGKLAVSLKEDGGQIAVVTVHDHAAGDAQLRSAKAAAAVANALQNDGVRSERLLVFGLGGVMKDSKPGGEKLGPHRVEVRKRGLATGGGGDGEAPSFKVPAGLTIDDQPVPEPLPATVQVRAGEPSLVARVKPDGSADLWQRAFAPRPGGGPAETRAPQSEGPDVQAFGADLLDALLAPTATPTAAQEPVEEKPVAAGLEVWLPKDLQHLGQPSLVVKGRAPKGVTVAVQGQDVPLDQEGRFQTRITLPVGASKLAVSATDKAGHRAFVEKDVTVTDRAWFLLAIADGSLAQVNAHLAEHDQPFTATLGPVALHGRVAAHLRGRIAGNHLGFKDLAVTAHLDTARDPALQSFATNLFDPRRFYPVYGDAGELEEGAPGNTRLYVKVEAEKAKLVLGAMRARLAGPQLVQFDRALEGVWLDVARKLGPGETGLKVVAAQQDRTTQRHVDVLRGTGGSLYLLKGRDVVLGSERVEIVVRDRIAGTELARLPQTRHTDYTLDEREGRILFKSPVSGAVDAGFALRTNGLAGQNLHWNGHPVFVEVTYEARSQVGTDDPTLGAQLTEKLAEGKVELGATYVQEGRGDGPTHRQVGAHATVALKPGTKLTAEWGWSEARAALVAVSDDGGLTFGTPTQPQIVDGNGKTVRGHGAQVRLDVALDDWVGKPVALPDGTTQEGLQGSGHVRAQWQWLEPGFQSQSSVMRQGSQSVLLDAQVPVARRHVLGVRYDGLLDATGLQPFAGANTAHLWGTGNTANSGSFSALRRHTVAVTDAFRLDGKWTLTGGLGYGYGEDGAGTWHHSQTLSAGAVHRLSERVTLRAEQQAVLGGDASLSTSQFAKPLDHFTTSAGIEWRFTKGLAATVTERLGWGGQNATAAGLRADLDDTSHLYVQQRLEDPTGTGTMQNATVLGAESRYGKDQTSRAFGEYQVDALNPERMNRAVLGVGKRFAIGSGKTLDASFERQQTFGGAAGEQARDVLSLGGEWVDSDKVKVTTRQELRLDEGGANANAVRKLQLVSLTNGLLGVSQELALFGRLGWQQTWNQTAATTEAQGVDATLGFAFRPTRAHPLQVVSKWSHLVDLRPAGEAGTAGEHSVRDVVALEPVVELPWRFQLGEKLAWRRAYEGQGDMGPVASDLALWVNRLGWHATQKLDLFAEYRLLSAWVKGNWSSGDVEHGALLEAAFKVAKHLRIGAGWNFTRFVETPRGDIERKTDAAGFFLRVTGLY
jgi:uncharacterized repeat protein (TIGR01451 family)/fimbrial isopeptide formation D2 family protein